jgi:hypothetical protein
MAPLPHSARAPFLLTILTTGVHLGVFALHSPFLYLDTPHLHPPSSDWPWLLSSQTFSRINTPTISSRLFFLLTPPMKMGQSVPKRRHIKFRGRGITQTKEYIIRSCLLQFSQEHVKWPSFERGSVCCAVCISICNTETSLIPSLWLRILDINCLANEVNSLEQHLAPVYRCSSCNSRITFKSCPHLHIVSVERMSVLLCCWDFCVLRVVSSLALCNYVFIFICHISCVTSPRWSPWYSRIYDTYCSSLFCGSCPSR